MATLQLLRLYAATGVTPHRTPRPAALRRAAGIFTGACYARRPIEQVISELEQWMIQEGNTTHASRDSDAAPIRPAEAERERAADCAPHPDTGQPHNNP